ncbi:MAG: enoyl-CoA hydratase-related protein [Georgfuchsia sp.]
MRYEHILFEKREKSTWITINHPERYNSFDGDTVAELTDAVLKAGKDKENVAIVITGAGDDSFSAGGYLKDLTNFDKEMGRHLFGGAGKCFDAIRQAPMPVIAAVNGWAMGGGNELVVAADFAIASDRARFGQTGPRIGSSPIYGGTNMLAMNIGEKRAKEVCMMCRPYPAQEALAMGWINKVVPHEELHAEVDRWIEELSYRSPSYLEITKVSANMWWDMMKPCIQHGEQMLLLLAGSEEMTEGATAFMEKRKPDFMRFRKNNPK